MIKSCELRRKISCLTCIKRIIYANYSINVCIANMYYINKTQMMPQNKYKKSNIFFQIRKNG